MLCIMHCVFQREAGGPCIRPTLSENKPGYLAHVPSVFFQQWAYSLLLINGAKVYISMLSLRHLRQMVSAQQSVC